MLKIEHTLCPACSVGCGLNIISKNNQLVGINPYKNHEINEGRNCSNCTTNIDNYKENKVNLSKDYDQMLDESAKLLKEANNNEVAVVVSGNIDNVDLDAAIEFAGKHGYNLLSYEYNFTKIDSDLIPKYEEIEKATTIITIGDIYRNNSLIARRIIHAKDNGCCTININNINNLTAYNSDEFIQIESGSQIKDILNSQKLTNQTIILVNEIDSPENYNSIVEFVKEKNIKILPLLKNANSFSVIEKTNPLGTAQLNDKIKEQSVVILLDNESSEFLDQDLLSDKTVISLDSINNDNGSIVIPIKAWYEKEGSFTNSEGLTQEFEDTISSDTQLKTIADVFNQLDGLLGD